LPEAGRHYSCLRHFELMLCARGFILWFTGLPGSGKSTLSDIVANVVRERGMPVEILDGDEIRTNLSKGLGFSKEDRNTNIHRIAYVARLLARNGVCVITAAISPYRETRDAIRQSVYAEGRADFVEVYLECPIAALIERDVKGLYRKALAGEIKNFTGVSDPYEPPVNPELALRTDTEKPGASAARIITLLESLHRIPAHSGTGHESRRTREIAALAQSAARA